jgi:hypothetical protein
MISFVIVIFHANAFPVEAGRELQTKTVGVVSSIKQCAQPCLDGTICSATEMSTWTFCEDKGDVYSCRCPTGNFLMISNDRCFKADEFEGYRQSCLGNSPAVSKANDVVQDVDVGIGSSIKQCSKTCPEGRICSATEVSTWPSCELKGDVYSCHCPTGNYLMIAADYCFKAAEFEENRQYCLGNPTAEAKQVSSESLGPEDHVVNPLQRLRRCPKGTVRADKELEKWTVFGVCETIRKTDNYICTCETGYTPIINEKDCIDAEDFRRKCLGEVNASSTRRGLESESEKESASDVEAKNHEESSNEGDIIV